MTSDRACEKAIVRPVILSGGAGTRLWPVSRPAFPKQLLPIAGAETMLQATAARVTGPGFASPLVVADEQHRFLVSDQLRETDVVPHAILIEPIGRNTAAAIGFAANWALQQNGDELLLVLPSDHVIGDARAFRAAVEAALPAAEAGGIVTFGIPPDRPHSGYGYIELGDESADHPGVRRVARFVEKPSTEVAREYLGTGRFVWNSGMFLFRASRIVGELELFAPELAKAVALASLGSVREGPFVRPDGEAFASAPAISIDCAVMERSDEVYVIPVEIGWSDVGSWDSLWAISGKDAQGNVIHGHALAVDSRDCLIRSEHEQLVVAVGVEGLAIVVTSDAILISDRVRSQEVKDAVDMLRERGHESVAGPSEASLDSGMGHNADHSERSQTTRVTIDPGNRLSLQDRRRFQCWIVIEGTAEVIVGDAARLLEQNESICLPPGSPGHIANPGEEPLHLMAVEYEPEFNGDDAGQIEEEMKRQLSAGH